MFHVQLYVYNLKLKKVQRDDSTIQMYLIGTVKITEIFFILNYGLHFYFYCFSGSRFFNLISIF
jgi:hypothetical protein